MKKAFTLLETLVYISVLIIISSALVGFLIWALNVNAKIRAQSEVTNNAERALHILNYEIRHSQAVYIPNCSFGTDNGQLSLVTDQNLPIDENMTYHDIYLSNGIVYLKKESQDALALTNDQTTVEKLRFSLVDADSVEISLQLKYNLTNKPQWQNSQTWQTIVSLRGIY